MNKASDIISASEKLKKLAGQGREFTVSKQTVNRVESIEMVRTAREQGKQQLVYSSRPFVLCGLPVKRPQKGVLKHLRRNGKFFLKVTGDPDLGLPFGQDRLIPIWVATLAIKQNNRFISFKSAAEILETFGLPKDGPHYRRLVDGFKRIFGATISFGTDQQMRNAGMFDWTRFHFFDRMKIWYTKHLDQQQLPSEDFQNQILLSENFWSELQRHPIPIDLEAVKALANAPAQLDFYCWLVWRCWSAKGETSIPLSGEAGLMAQLGISEKTAARDFRIQVRKWLVKTKALWPGCPARLAGDGTALIVSHGRAIAARQPTALLKP